MKHEPLMTLPSDDAHWWATVDEYQRQLNGLLRARNWDAAERLAMEFFERAGNAYEAAVYSRSRATMLMHLGRQDAALEADALAERLVPVEPYFKINTAQRLIELGRPTEGLSKLAEAEALMEPSARIGLLGDRAVALLALGRDGEALECFRQIASPERLAHMRARCSPSLACAPNVRGPRVFPPDRKPRTFGAHARLGLHRARGFPSRRRISQEAVGAGPVHCLPRRCGGHCRASQPRSP